MFMYIHVGVKVYMQQVLYVYIAQNLVIHIYMYMYIHVYIQMHTPLRNIVPLCIYVHVAHCVMALILSLAEVK